MGASFVDRVSICEPRFALSTSVAADALIDLLSSTPLGLEPTLQASADPFAEAAQLRERFSLDGSGQTVAVIDSGIAWNHLAFANQKSGPIGGGFGAGYRVVGGWDFAENDANPYDDGPAGYHGTHVAGTLGGATDGFSGIAPGADLVALRVFDDLGRGSLDWIESALRWVVDNRNLFENPITTVNLSLGAFAIDAGAPLTQFDDELRALRDNGVIVVAAAGNSFDASRPDSLAYPASHPLVAAVTSVDANGAIHDFAQRGTGVFAAPGSAIRGSVPDHVLGIDGQINDFASIDGTSMATPQFAGATMLVREAMQSIGMTPTPEDILAHLQNTSLSRTDAATGASYYVLDLENAIQSILGQDQGGDELPAPTSPLQWSDGGTLVVRGSDDADQVVLDLSSSVHGTLRINSIVYTIDRAFTSLAIDGGAGNDSLEIIGTSGDERLVARAATPTANEPFASLQTTTALARFDAFENVVFRGGGGNDRATMFDSAGNDTLEATASSATLRGIGFTFAAIDVNNIYAHGNNGGSDIAYLYDSAADDQLSIRHQFTSLRSESLFRVAFGFEKVHAFAGNGGFDQAELFDSPGDDRMSASASSAWISGSDYYAGARGFHSIRAEATAGGNDYATLYAADASANWTRSDALLQLNATDGSFRSAQGFETTEAFVAGVKTEVLPQSIRQRFFEEERKALRELFAMVDEERDSPEFRETR